MSQTYLQLIQGALNECSPETKKFLFAIISCPEQLDGQCLFWITKRVGISRQEAQDFLEWLKDEDLVGDSIPEIKENRDFYSHTLEITEPLFVAAVSLMEKDDVMSRELEQEFNKRNIYSYAIRIDKYKKHALFLECLLSCPKEGEKPIDKLGIAPSDYSVKEMSGELQWFTTQLRWKPFFASLDKESAQRFYDDICPSLDFFSRDDWYMANVICENLSAMNLKLEHRIWLHDWLLFHRFFREGHPEKILSALSEATPFYHLMTCVIALLANDSKAASRAAKKALSLCNFPLISSYENRYSFHGTFENFIFALALYADRQGAGTRRTMESILKYSIRRPDEASLFALSYMGLHALEKADYWLEDMAKYDKTHDAFAQTMLGMICYAFHMKGFYGEKPSDKRKEKAKSVISRYPLIELFWLAATDSDPEKVAELEAQFGMKSLISSQRKVEAWENLLDELLDYTASKVKKTAATGTKGPKYRIIYGVNIKSLSVTPFLQRCLKTGKISEPKEITLRVFEKMTSDKGMTQQDLDVASKIKLERSWSGVSRYLYGEEVFRLLIGHPYVYDVKNMDMRYEVLKGEFQIEAKKDFKQFIVHTNIDEELKSFREIPNCIVREKGVGQIEVIDISEEQKKLYLSFKKKWAFPAEAQDKLTQLFERLSVRMPVMSELLNNSVQLEKIKASSKLTVRVVPEAEDWYTIRVVLCPVEESPVTCEPGKGSEFLALNLKGKPVQVVRNLKKEKEALSQFEHVVTPWENDQTGDFEWDLDTSACLKFLSAVRSLKDDVIVQWPEGAKFKVSYAPISFSSLQFSVNRMGSWFEVKGEVSLDGKTKLKMAELLRMVRESKGDFISLGDAEYVALTEGLKKQLLALDRTLSGKGSSQLSSFNAGVLGDLEKQGAVLNADKEYRDLQERIAKAETVTALVPATLQAQLRDYQVDGFEWMMRLASWGAGALLADDMGLGKTVQTIAVLLSRAKEGPQLVTVPASVLFNWQEELTRFSPSLKQVILNTESNRAEAIEKAGKNTVVLSTYGVLTSEVEAIAKKTWVTAVYDEAHNIKNRDTKAFKAATSIKADFRVLLTGTPLQNHLSEIWALFEVAVPGLLGSFNHFGERFVLPIERDKDREQQRLLKRIVSPFILRRTKADVLSELPEKTETTIKVELSQEERALYEQLREETKESLETGEINPVQALAALMKLRRAACSPELVDSKLKLPSSKTQVFLGLVEELIENHHRALVFSQFTSHLALIRRALEEKGIEYLYLDGAVSSAQRQKLVSAFEEGTMPLFLISLKAGGTGLNLTAADYVIHMDPWWNPAIEDQASDRTYRIGQDRPVTIYRLIASGTVEEKILKLHSTKKSLADALLEGSEMSSRLGRDEIMELLALAR